MPVIASGIRFFAVVGLGGLGVALGWEVSGIFWVVSLGLILIGIGQALCLFTRAWRPDAGVS